ncbi:Gp138 family membrane-puncturing spike protein [Burkholderia vietnamiensis]|uniref:Gp138 family membrane-puncturing spike protein n=1 Tax=Burkholderia vietnamiensis TaxID=60552 RepID=UPI00264A9D60|nr:Gp138 family membrane-puncturing spike protein [Burkholderia vietnamiensis]MDN7925700.1 Gp138 family membrane-puncturing spike protein [Burkholderia vietnamiensis]
MDKIEMAGDLLEMTRTIKDSVKRETWSALPGVIESFNPDAMTCTVQPAIKLRSRDEQGQLSSLMLPLLVDCPVYFPGGGGCTLTFPVTRGDECLIVFADRAIDAWWQSGGVQETISTRVHDLSDGMVFVGFRSRPRVPGAISTTTTQLRTDDGAMHVELDPGGGVVSLKAPTEILMDAPVVRLTGAMAVENQGGADTSVSINGKTSFNGQVFANGKRVDDTHTHPDAQGGNTGPVS